MPELVWTCGGEIGADKYDMVFIVGVDMANNFVEELKKKSVESGLKICGIGDGGEDSFLTEDLLKSTLSGKIGENTHVHIHGHGYAQMTEKGKYQRHAIGIYQSDNPELLSGSNQITCTLLEFLKNEIFDKDTVNENKDIAVELWSCHAGAVAKHAPDGIKLILHGGKKYTSLIAMNLDGMLQAITERKLQTDIYNRVYSSLIHSPETLHYVEGGKIFKASAPKVEDEFPDKAESHIKRNITLFDNFRREELKHDFQLNTDIEISSVLSTRYYELAFIMEVLRGKDRQHLEKYISKGTNVNAVLTNGNTALYIACQKGH